MKKKTAAILATFVFGFLIFILVLKAIDTRGLAESFRQFALFPFLAFILVSIFMQMACVYRWRTILEAHGYKIEFWTLFIYKIAGFSLCYITPGALIGGEALRAYLLKRHDVKLTEGASSVIIDKFFDLAIAALFASIGLIVFISFFSISEYAKAIILLVTVLWVVALSFFLYGSLTGKGFFRHIFNFFRLHRIKQLEKLKETIEETEVNISHFFLKHKDSFRRAAVISLIVWILMFVEYKIATSVFGYEADIVAVFLIICMVGFSYTFPVPGGLGILEATQATLHAIMGLSGAQGIALSFLIRARDIMWTLLGMGFLYKKGISIIKQISAFGKK